MARHPAAVLGALEDRSVASQRPLIVTNVGNMHCLAFRLGGDGIEGLFEHHTGKLSTEWLEDLLERLAAGNLTHAEIFQGHGHGAVLFQRDAIPQEERHVLVTGPRRGLLRESRLNPTFATPFGDMILAGCYGVIRAYGDLVPGAGEIIDRASAGGGGKSLW